jgi:hypothetical protein
LRIAEVRFFAVISNGIDKVPVTLISVFSRPDPTLFHLSVNVLWSCAYQGDSSLEFVDVNCIQAVVAMVPHTPVIDGQEASERFFLVEKPGYDVAIMTGLVEGSDEGNVESGSDLAGVGDVLATSLSVS